MLRSFAPRYLWASVVAVALLTSCTPNRKSVEVVNPCDRATKIRIWDRPQPGNLAENFFKDVDIGPSSDVKVKEAVTDVGNKGWSAEVLAGPGAGELLHIGDSRVLILPAHLCARE